MSFKPPTMEEVNQELSQLDARLVEYNSLIARKQVLLDYKAILSKMAPNGSLQSKSESVSTGSEPDMGTTAVIQRVLSSVEQMHVNDILAGIRSAGWRGSGDDRVDKGRIHAAVNRRKDIFESIGNGVWRIRK